MQVALALCHRHAQLNDAGWWRNTRFAYAIQELLRVIRVALNETNEAVEELKWRLASSIDVSHIEGVAAVHLVSREKKLKLRRKARRDMEAVMGDQIRAPFPQHLKERFLEPLADDDHVRNDVFAARLSTVLLAAHRS